MQHPPSPFLPLPSGEREIVRPPCAMMISLDVGARCDGLWCGFVAALDIVLSGSMWYNKQQFILAQEATPVEVWDRD